VYNIATFPTTKYSPTALSVTELTNPLIKYHMVQNSGGVKLWRISDFEVLARKTLANAQHLYYWQEKNFGKSEGELSFIKQKPTY